jgi:hypothetical protein
MGFKDELFVARDGAPYFRVTADTDFAARDGLVFVTLSSNSLEFNPVG